MKLSIIFSILIATILLSCKDKTINDGVYLNLHNQNVYKISGKQLIQSNIVKSKRYEFDVNIKNNIIELKNDSTSLNYNYDYENDSLILSSIDNSSENKITLKKIPTYKNLNSLYENFWIIRYNESQYLLKVNQQFNRNAYLYKKIDNLNVGDYFFDNEFFPLNRFKIEYSKVLHMNFIILDARFFDYRSFVILELNSDSLKLYDFKSKKMLIFKKYINPNIIPFNDKFMRY